MTRLQRGLHFRPDLLEDLEQRGCTAIPEANPNELKRRLRPISKVKKVLVFANDDAPIVRGVFAKLGVGCLRQTGIKDVFAVDAFLAEIHSQRGWQLVINQKLHEA
jgi:hypothetical protein